MNGYTTVINSLGTLAQTVSATDRWKAVRNAGPIGRHAGLLWWILIVLGILAVGGLMGSWLYSRRQERNKWVRFGSLGQHAGLRDKETSILKRLVMLAGLKDPGLIFTDEDVFNAAALKLMTSKQVMDLSDHAQLDLQSTMMSIHAKLRFGIVDDGDELDVFRSSRQIETGAKVFISKMGEQRSLEATITRNTRLELLITADEDIPARRDGDLLTVRYALGHGAWEFDSRVIRCDGQSVAVEHSRELRTVNFRRFPRIPTRMNARGTALPFHVGSCDTPLEFVQANILEIAGPGLLVKLPVEVEIGQNMLVRVQLADNRFVQGMTKVRRIVTNRPGGPFVAVEFVELEASELTELTRATNLAAKRLDGPKGRWKKGADTTERAIKV